MEDLRNRFIKLGLNPKAFDNISTNDLVKINEYINELEACSE